MKSKCIKLLCMMLSIITLASCSKDEEVFTGNIVGKVTDAATGEVLQGVTVTITPGGNSRTTGADGYFEFRDLEPRQYEIQARKAEYVSNNKLINVTTGVDASGDLQLTPVRKDAKLSLDVSSLNFGSRNTSLSFNIINSGNDSFNWNISGLEKLNWLEITPTTGKLQSGKSNAVQVNLLRDMITEDKEATIIINADNESVALKITAEVESKTSKIVLSANTLNFGTEYNSLTFDIKNIGNAGDVSWDISGIDAEWVKITPNTGVTAMGKSSVVKVEIDREKLNDGVNNTNIIVNADGESLHVAIKAEKTASTPDGGNDGNINNPDIDNSDYSLISCDDNLLFTINSCTISGNVATIDMKVKNIGNTSTTLRLRGSSEGSFGFDDQGNKCNQIDVALSGGSFSSWGSSSELPAGITSKVSIKINNVSELSSIFKILKIKTNKNSDIIIQNLKIEGRKTSELSASKFEGNFTSCSEELQFTMLDCKYGTNYTYITFRVKNVSNKTATLKLRGSSEGSFGFDDQGNKCNQIDVALSGGSFSSWGSSSELPAGIISNGEIRFYNVDSNATTFDNITIKTNYNDDLIFSNVKIRK